MVAHACSVAVRLLADRVGLTKGLSAALIRRAFRPVHDRGRVLVDWRCCCPMAGRRSPTLTCLRHQRQVLGPVASAPTVWRTLDELTLAAVRRVEKTRAKVRRHVWAQLSAGGGLPPSRVGGTDLGETVVLDVDATLGTVHSEKEAAAPTFKGGFGYHPVRREALLIRAEVRGHRRRPCRSRAV